MSSDASSSTTYYVLFGDNEIPAKLVAQIKKLYGDEARSYKLEGLVYSTSDTTEIARKFYSCHPMKTKHPLFRIKFFESDPISLQCQPYYPALCVSSIAIDTQSICPHTMGIKPSQAIVNRFGRIHTFPCHSWEELRPVESINYKHIMKWYTKKRMYNIHLCIAYTCDENGFVNKRIEYAADLIKYLAWIHVLRSFQRRIRHLLSLRHTMKQLHLIPSHIPSDVAGVVTQYVTAFPNCRHICIKKISVYFTINILIHFSCKRMQFSTCGGVCLIFYS